MLMSVLTTIAVVCCADLAAAMEIRQYDRMAIPDQGNYIAVLIAGAQKVLKDEGRDNLAAQVRKLFTAREHGNKLSTGMMEFETNLAHARAVDADTHAHDPKAERLEVEQALIVTLKWSDIVLPKSFMQVGDRFRPKRRRQ
jgi:preprotein translocase subunit SecD